MSSPQPPVDGPRNPFAVARFRTWLIASLLAGTGAGIQGVTVPIYIRDRVDFDVRALAIALALVAQTLPGTVLALFGGALADRVEQRRILRRTYAIAAVASVAYVALVMSGGLLVWPVFALGAIVGSAMAFSNPARQSMLPQLVSRAQLQNGVIFGTMGFMATFQFIGPMVGGLLTDGFGLATAFGAEALLLALAAATFARVPTETPSPTDRHIWEDLRAGVAYVVANPTLRGLLFLGTIPGTLFIGPFAVTIPLMVPDVFGAPDRWVGLLSGCFGAGVLTGSILLAIRPLPKRGLAVSLTSIAGGAILIAYSSVTSIGFAAALLFIWGMSASVFMNYVIALLQEHADPPMMGRVMSMYSLSFYVSMPIGYAQAGIVTRLAGPETSLLSSGVVAMAIGLACVALLRSVRDLD